MVLNVYAPLVYHFIETADFFILSTDIMLFQVEQKNNGNNLNHSEAELNWCIGPSRQVG